MAAPPVAAAPAQAPDLKDTWVCVENGNLFKRGDVIATDPTPLPAGHVILGDKGIVPDAGETVFVQKVAQTDIARFRLEDLRVSSWVPLR